MEQLYNPDGTRNREYRPYIFAEETTYNTSLYDPFRAVDYGLYKTGSPPLALTNPQDVAQYNWIGSIQSNGQFVESRPVYATPSIMSLQEGPYQIYASSQMSSYKGGRGMYKRLWAT
jgi:hypothetical protein